MPQSKHTQRMERRTSARTDANLSMRLMGARAETALPEFVTETENVSSSGVYCFSPHYLAPLSKVGLTLVLPDRRSDEISDRMLKCEAVVVRCQQNPATTAARRYEVACSFLDLDDDHRQLIDEFVTLRNLKALRAPSAATRRRTRKKAVRAARTGVRKAVVRAKAKVAKKAAKKKAVRAVRSTKTAVRGRAAASPVGRTRTSGRSRAR
jgi:hypothetical protein